MACCTIPAPINANKRSHDFDLDWEQSPSTSSSNTTTSSLSSNQQAQHRQQQAAHKSIKRRRCGSTMYTVINHNDPHLRQYHKDHNGQSSSSISIIDANQKQKSIFQSINEHNQLSNNELLEKIRNEAKRYIRRHQLNIQHQHPQSSTSTTSLSSPTSTSAPLSVITKCTNTSTSDNTTTTTTTTNVTSINQNNSTTINNNNKINTNNNHLLLRNDSIPLFTIAQVNSICAKLVKEREDSLVEQYNLLLNEKLSEEYDKYVRFTHDQLQKKFENSQFTYVS